MKDFAVRFGSIAQPYVYGYHARTRSGLMVEVVRSYAGGWNVFITGPWEGDSFTSFNVGSEKHSVVARSVEEYRRVGNGYLSFQAAVGVARRLLTI